MGRPRASLTDLLGKWIQVTKWLKDTKENRQFLLDEKNCIRKETGQEAQIVMEAKKPLNEPRRIALWRPVVLSDTVKGSSTSRNKAWADYLKDSARVEVPVIEEVTP